ncbi:Kynureninase [Liparis tanakae]|uniref:Kynureninase n=1 Tax=Liparis tanakae TaxID=230148 RepID=A0A4Z2EP12_9TELE|nr:Kynureninase [Liparis tanakae]
MGLRDLKKKNKNNKKKKNNNKKNKKKKKKKKKKNEVKALGGLHKREILQMRKSPCRFILQPPAMDQLLDPARRTVERVAALLGCSTTSAQVAAYLDEHDELRHLREEFLVPTMQQLPHTDLSLVDGAEECVYLAGNSLGLQPRRARQYLEEELDKWAAMGVHGHTRGARPWAWAEDHLEGAMAEVVGAEPEEVALMNGLTVNLHLLLVTCCRPV